MAKDQETESHRAWDAYVKEVSDAATLRDIEIISSRVKGLTAEGRDTWKCLSPFREEKTASFYFYHGRGWFDFGTSEGGNILQFLQRFYRCNHREAVDMAASECGLLDWDQRKKGFRAPAEDPETLLKRWREGDPSVRVFGAATWLAHFCHEQMPTMVREHLESHYGYSEWFIGLEKVGYVPGGLWEIIHEPGVECPYTDVELLGTGWFHKLAKGVTPTLANRIVFPYWKDGQCRYAIGREYFGRATRKDVLPAYYQQHAYDQGKYKKLSVHSDKFPWVSPCVQNDVLWGEDCLRLIRDGVLTIAEGVTDAGALAMLGFPVISPVTIAFRDQDVVRVIALLGRYRVKRVIILNDNDSLADGRSPGLEGAKKMAMALWKAGIDVRIARLPRPEGASKVDINEVIVKALAEGRGDAMSRSDKAEDHARRVVQKIIDTAESYPEFLANEHPTTARSEDFEPLLVELGTLAERMPVLQKADLIAGVLKRFPQLPKRPARKIFDMAVARATNARVAAEKAAAAANEGAPGGPGAADGGAAAAGGAAPPEGGKARRLRGRVTEDPGGYYLSTSEEGEGLRISDFCFRVLKRVAPVLGGANWFSVRVEKAATGWDAQEGQTETVVGEWTIPSKAWVSARAFLSAFPNEGMHWTGTDNELQGLGELVSRAAANVPRILSTGVLGRHTMPDGSLRFVLVAGTLGPDGRWMETADLVYLPDGGSNLQHRLPTVRQDLDAPETLALAREFFEGVLLLHEAEPIATIVSWLTATLFGPFLRQKLGSFPILNVFATTGSGKTSEFNRILWPAYTGVRYGELLSCTSSAFAFARDFSSANALALILDEFKESDMGPKAVENLYRNIRRIYSGDTETRGRPDQDVNVYALIVCLAILGEQRIDHDQATAERLIYVALDANWLGDHPDARALFKVLMHRPLATIAPLLQSWSLLADAEKIFADATRLLDVTLAKLGRGRLPERIHLNAFVVAFGAVGTNAAATHFGTVTANVAFEKVIDRLLRETFDEGKGFASSRMRDCVDEMIVTAAELAIRGLLIEGRDYVLVDGKLRLWLAGIEAARAEALRAQGLPAHTPGRRALLRTAAEKMATGTSYVTSLSQRTQISDDRRVNCLEIDPELIPASLGVEAFPTAKEKTWGGLRGGKDAKKEPN